MFVALNFATRPATIRLPDPTAPGGWRVGRSIHDRQPGDPLQESLILAPLEALIAYD